MKELIVTSREESVQMTSLDIAGVTGKRHAHIMRDIRNEIKELGEEFSLPIFGESTYTNERGRKYDCFILNKEGAMQLAMKYDAKTRYSAIQYIKQLEEKMASTNAPSYMIDDPVQRAEKWIIEQKER